MTDILTSTKNDQKTETSITNINGLVSHKNAIKHLEESANHHNDAIKHHLKGNHELALLSTFKAIGHYDLAGEFQKEDVKLHTLSK